MYKKISVIEIESTTACNSFCPGCIRYQPVGTKPFFKEKFPDLEPGLYRNSDTRINQHISLENIRTIFESKIINTDEVFVDLIGTAGDPMAHPKIFEILQLIKKLNSNASFNIHTNAGLRTPKLFAQIGDLFKSTNTRYMFKFSIDGLEDTNHIYRRGVSWKKIIQNAQAFIDAGGEATWQFIEFPWNRHQIKEAEQLARKIGFVGFEHRRGWVSDEEAHEQVESTNFGIFNKEIKKVDINEPVPDSLYIKDDCFSKEGIFVNPDGTVHPCCMFNAEFANPGESRRQLEVLYKNFKNNLNENTLDEIMSENFWLLLNNTLTDKPCDTCHRMCGVYEKDGKRWVNENVKAELVL